MAKYLGGIRNPDVEIFKLKSPGWLDFDFYLQYADYSADGDIHDYSIYDSILRYEELTAESHRDYSLTWGAAGYLLSGPVGGLVGAVLGGSKIESHIVFCELNNGWQFAVQLDTDEFRTWKKYMDDAVKNNKPKIKN